MEEKYLPELMAEKDSLDPSFTHALRLVNQGEGRALPVNCLPRPLGPDERGPGVRAGRLGAGLWDWMETDPGRLGGKMGGIQVTDSGRFRAGVWGKIRDLLGVEWGMSEV